MTRLVPLTDGVPAILLEDFSESPYVFPRAGNPLHHAAQNVSRQFDQRLTNAGIRGASWVPRHTFASRLLQNGVDIVTVSKWPFNHYHDDVVFPLAKTALHEAVNSNAGLSLELQPG